MGLQLLLVQNSLHRGFGGTSQTGMASSFCLLAYMRRQGFARPQFGGIAQIFGLSASKMHHPGFVRTPNDRGFGPVKSVFEPGFYPHVQGLVLAMVIGDRPY